MRLASSAASMNYDGSRKRLITSGPCFTSRLSFILIKYLLLTKKERPMSEGEVWSRYKQISQSVILNSLSLLLPAPPFFPSRTLKIGGFWSLRHHLGTRIRYYSAWFYFYLHVTMDGASFLILVNIGLKKHMGRSHKHPV